MLNYLRNVGKLNEGLTDNFADSCLCALSAALVSPRRVSAVDSCPVWSQTERLHV